VARYAPAGGAARRSAYPEAAASRDASDCGDAADAPEPRLPSLLADPAHVGAGYQEISKPASPGGTERLSPGSDAARPPVATSATCFSDFSASCGGFGDTTPGIHGPRH
jgi:hypothetical protein